MQEFIAVLPVDAEVAQVFGCLGSEARRVLLGAKDGSIELRAPEGAGLHVWAGRIQGDDLDGEWRRATAADLERFGFPLCEDALAEENWHEPKGSTMAEVREAAKMVHPDAGAPFCCKMREKFVPGILAENAMVPTPTDMVDHVVHWGKRIVFALSYCPFCGKKMQRGVDTLRVNPDDL